MADNEFKPITDAVAPAFVNLVAAGEHVGDIEVFLRVIQEYQKEGKLVISSLPSALEALLVLAMYAVLVLRVIFSIILTHHHIHHCSRIIVLTCDYY